MKITKRLYCLHDGNLIHNDSYSPITRFVNTEGKVCNHTEDYVFWQHMGVFLTKAKALNFAKKHSIKLDVHSHTVHSDWMYNCFLEDLVKED